MTSSGALVEEAPVVPQPAPAPSHNQPDATEPVTPTTSAGSGSDSSGDRGKQGQEQHQQQQQGEAETEQCEGEKIDKQMLEDKQQQRTRAKELPDEYLNGQWDAEPFYYVTMANSSARNNGSNTTPNDGGEATRRRQKRGVIYKHRENMEYECFQSHEGVVYRPGDQVFVESSREEPWMIGAIVSFKMKKRDQLLVKLLRYYRPPDVPELSFSLITQERIEEGHFHATRQSHARELFSSDSALLFHISALRGKCTVKLVKDLRSALAEVDLADPDSFFHCLNYNQESGRLASVQMSIRVGSAHQADVPSCSTAAGISDEADRDELLYRPGYLCAETEVKYVKMARAFRTFSLINNKRITTLEKATRTGDLLLDDAITTLHRCKYNIVDGINEMQGNDEHLTSDSSFMSADDVKKFGKGIKTYGKAFNKINRDLLPHHRREQLVAFYYLWKKSRDATRPKPLSNAMKRNQAALIAAGTAAARRIKNGNGDNGTVAMGAAATTPDGVTGAANCGGTITGGATWRSEMSNGGLDGIESLNAISLDDLMDYESASEIETEQMESAERMPSRACHHCFGIKSKDWHHVGHERLLMCTDCRLFYKKYGQLRPVDRPRTVPPCLLSNTPARTTTTSPNGDDENEEPLAQTLPVNRIRTRGAGRQLLLQREQQRSRRTPSSLDGDRTTRRTPQRAIATAGGTEATEGTAESNGTTTEQQRRSTPLRNATKSRKRAHREGTATTDSGTDQTPTPSSKDSKRHKKDNSALPSAASSRTPSPPQQQEDVKEANTTVSNSGETSVPEESAAEQPLLLRRPDAEGNGTITPPAGTVATTTNSTGSISKSNELNLPSTAALSSAPNSPNEQLKENPPQNEPSSALTTSKVSAPQALVKKPVAKVEPLDNTKKDGERNVATDQEEMLQSDSCCPATEQEDAMAVLEVEEDGVGQDMGPIGESDEAEGFRTTNKESLEEGKVTVLIRRLRRSNGLSCARTDLAYIEVPERQQWRERKTREASERTVRKSAGGGSGNNAPTMPDQKQLQMNSQQHKQFGNATGGGAKKMEMPSEFLPNGMTPADAPPPSAAAVLASPLMANPAIAMMNGLFIPPQVHPSLVSSTSASLHTNSASNSTAANNANTSSSSGHMANTALGSTGFAGATRLPAGAAAAGYTHSQQQQSLGSAQHQQQQMVPGMATALLQQQQQQHAHDQQQQQAVLAAAAMQISAMGGAANAQQQQQLHNVLMGMAQQQQQQQPQQQYQHQLQQMLMHFAMQEQHQQQKMMELQRQQQQQQQKRATVAQQQQQQHSLLNGQHPHPLGHAAAIGQMHHQQQQQQPHAGHVFNGISAAQSAAHHQQQQSQQPKEQLHQQQQNHQQMMQQQQSQQQNAAVAALMGQLFGAATFQQQQQQQAAMFALQQRAAAPPAVQQQQAPPPAHPPSALPSNTAQNIGTAQNGPNVAQQQQQAMMLLEMAAAAAMNPQQLMALMAGSGLDARTLDELRGHLLNQQQQQQQLTANAAAAQHQQQQQALAAQQQQAVQHQQQQMLAMLAASGALTPEQLQVAVIGQQQQQNSAPALHTPSTSSSIQQQQHQMQQQMQQQMALAAIQQQQQQQAVAAQQQHHHHNQQQQQQFVQIQQQMEMLRRMQQHHQEQQQQQR
ncbi:hypothetical protein niasHS_006860 [Heterodera schachtii]|uniref:Uncharacterized protein n=1 Tax=Heterodera schachtii TaxID=97005 RepID=A0ABD2JFV4_HETSC